MIALQGCGVNTGMNGSIVEAHIVLKKAVELLQGGDGVQVQGIEPGLFQRSKLPLNLSLGGTIPDFRM